MKWSLILLLTTLTSLRGYSQHGDEMFSKKNITGTFKYRDLKSFRVDSIVWKENQNGNLYSYYSSQRNKRRLEEFTVYTQYFGEVTVSKIIWYVIYDKNGKYLNRFVLAEETYMPEESGDGYFSTSFGVFVNDSTYQLQSEYGDKNGTEKESTYVLTAVKIKRNGKIEERILNRKKVKNYKVAIVEVKTPISEPKVFIAEDGHTVKNDYEVLLDNWLYNHDYTHSVGQFIPEPNQKSDFYLRNSDFHLIVFTEPDNEVNTGQYIMKNSKKFFSIFSKDFRDLDKIIFDEFEKSGIEIKRVAPVKWR